ncbi:MAG TPA: outer membrane beta-barrel family protein [Caulobacteraceae bacterium]|nr:outer membrane beta-barrel family protein [Caulobacteraceae bacterium]
MVAGGGAPAFAQSQQGQTQAPPSSDQTDAKAKKDGKASTVQGITVTSDRAQMRSDIDRRSYDITKDLGAQNGASLADSLRNVPSVDVDVNGGVTLRGQSGVTIMVDGKPSPIFSGPGGAQALLQIPADQFERVEVMTNPSAAFTPNGQAGIINLVSKKRQPMGSFGSVRASVADADRYRGGANATIRNGKTTVVLYAGGGRDLQKQDASGLTENFNPAGDLITTNTGTSNGQFRSNFGYGVGNVTWDLAPKTQLNLSLNAFHFHGEADSHGDDVVTDGSGAVLEDVLQTTQNIFGGTFARGELKLRQEFAGDDHNLTITLNHNRGDFDNSQRFTESFAAPVQPDTFQRSTQSNINNTTQFAGDYVRPMPSDGKLKAGWDVTQDDNHSNSMGFVDASSPTAPDDPSQTDLFHFQRTVSAGYVTYQQPFGKLTVLGGLRVENETLNIDSETSHIDVKSNDLHLYPTLHLSYTLDDAQTLMASYSERIQRPDDRSFDPFVRINGPFSESAGNPHLKPEQVQDYEGSWQYHGGGQFYIATLYYKQHTGGVTTITTDVGDSVLLTTDENLTRSKDAGLELVASGKLPHGLAYNISGNVYWNEIDGSALGFTETRSDTTVAGRASINWQADPNDFLQINLSARGRTLTPQGFTETKPTVNLGYRRKFTEKLSGLITVQDLFDTGGEKTVYDSPLLRGGNDFHQHDRAVFLGLTMTFGASPRGRPQQPDFDYGDQTPGGGSPH